MAAALQSRRMMTALLLTENFPPEIGGTSRWFWELYRRLPRSEVVIAAGAGAGAGAFDGTHDLRVERLPLSFPDRGVLSIRAWKTQRLTAAAIQLLFRRHAEVRFPLGRLFPEAWCALQF